jgi:hypothetical protein
MKYKIEIPHELYDEIKEYVILNELEITNFFIDVIKKGYMLKKYEDNLVIKNNHTQKLEGSNTNPEKIITNNNKLYD